MLNPLSLSTVRTGIHGEGPALDASVLDGAAMPLVRAALLRIGRTLGAWSERAAQRRALLQLSDHQLADIGIDRQRACLEAAKPFWHA